MSELLVGRRVLVTGGAHGLGAAIVARMAAEGATGFVVDLPAALDGAQPEGWRELAADVRSETSVRNAFATAAERPLDVVVACAGIVPPWTSIAKLDVERWDATFAVNARGVAITLREAARHVVDGAAIVVMASLNGWRGDPHVAGYVASKHAAVGLMRAAALDLGRRNIRVNALAPGPIATEALLGRMRDRAAAGGLTVEEALAAAAEQTALGRIATAQDVAAAALFLASDMSTGITGHLLPVDGGVI